MPSSSLFWRHVSPNNNRERNPDGITFLDITLGMSTLLEDYDPYRIFLRKSLNPINHRIKRD